MENKKNRKLYNRLKSTLYPYGFMLKEGKNHNADPFDYDLILLQFNTTERFHSPEENDANLRLLAKKLAQTVQQDKSKEPPISYYPPLFALEQDEI